MYKRKKKKDFKLFKPQSPVTRSKCQRLGEEEMYDDIMTVTEKAESPLSPSVIHEHIGGPDACSIWEVRQCLFNLKEKQIMKSTGDGSWMLNEKYNEGPECGVESANSVEVKDVRKRAERPDCGVESANSVEVKDVRKRAGPDIKELATNSPDVFGTEEPGNEDCSCPNAGDSCNHYHYHSTTNHYIQNGNGNHMYTGSHADFNHTYQRPF